MTPRLTLPGLLALTCCVAAAAATRPSFQNLSLRRTLQQDLDAQRIVIDIAYVKKAANDAMATHEASSTLRTALHAKYTPWKWAAFVEDLNGDGGAATLHNCEAQPWECRIQGAVTDIYQTDDEYGVRTLRWAVFWTPASKPLIASMFDAEIRVKTIASPCSFALAMQGPDAYAKCLVDSVFPETNGEKPIAVYAAQSTATIGSYDPATFVLISRAGPGVAVQTLVMPPSSWYK